MSELDRFRDALRFLTILPTPAAETLSPDWLARALKFFPAVGALVGAVCALVFVLASEIWPGLPGALLAVGAGIWLTGALHEDGLADSADALGGGTSVEQRLAIMKDSRIGTYGALALGFGVALRVAALAVLPMGIGAAALIATHALARMTPALAMARLPYAGDVAAMKVAYAETAMRSDERNFAFGTCALALLPLAWMAPMAALVALAAGSALAIWTVGRAHRRLGGYTGDILGAVEQMFEIGFLLGVAAIIGR